MTGAGRLPPTDGALRRERRGLPPRERNDSAYDAARADDPAKQIRSSARWQKVRRMKLARDPVCQECAREASAQVHHIVPLRRRPDLAYVATNLWAACTRCHAELEREERRARA